MATAAVDVLLERTAALLERCADVCLDSAEHAAASRDPSYERPKSVCRACAEVCDVTAELLLLVPERSEMLLAQVRAAYEATRTCAGECAQHDDPRSQACAGMCNLTRDELERLLAALARSMETGLP